MAEYNSGVKSRRAVQARPPKPLLLYDAECNFCKHWVARWQKTTAGRVELLAFQDEQVGRDFPELSREELAKEIHLVAPDGSVWSGAEAVVRALGEVERERWLLEWYEDFPLFARTSEWGYRTVARNRTVLSRLTLWCARRAAEATNHQLVRWVFLRGMGLIYLAAFISLWVQVRGLLGSNGILPAALRMEALGRQAAEAHLGWTRFHLVPTFCWFDSSDGFLLAQCAAGTLLSALLVLNLAPALCLAILWALYLSLTTIGGEFLSFQWDSLLLETGVLALFFAPLQWRPGLARAPPPSMLMLWLLRWLLFRLMFASGCVKLLSRDPTWRDLTALKFHYETQPLPTWLGWYAAQLPVRTQQVCTALMFVIELAVPFLVFGPRRLRQVACLLFVALQVLIFLTGNYCFFNLLTIALCVVLLDDAALRRLMPKWLRTKTEPEAQAEPAAPEPMQSKRPKARWPWFVLAPLAVVTVILPLMQFMAMFGVRKEWPRPVGAFYAWFAPFRSCNLYGLFAEMTTTRMEIVIEGSNDGTNWTAYEFKYKPGDVQRRPGFVEPHQPRLDWQMWFAALRDYRQNPWLVNFCVRLLQGSPDVLRLLEHNPFAAAPPQYIRAQFYEYHFTDWPARRRTGAWWSRELKGSYLPPISLKPSQQP